MAAAVGVERISDLASVPAGRTNLFDLDLKPIEARVLSEPWVRKVFLTKKFPQSLLVKVELRNPQALLQTDSGRIRYVDETSEVFGSLSLAHSADLPVLSGFRSDDRAKIGSVLKFIKVWEKSPCAQFARLSSISWEEERGYRAWISYPMTQGWGRALVTLGHELGDEEVSSMPGQLERVSKVLRYLALKNLQARRIWADTGKKIVVRIARRS